MKRTGKAAAEGRGGDGERQQHRVVVVARGILHILLSFIFVLSFFINGLVGVVCVRIKRII